MASLGAEFVDAALDRGVDGVVFGGGPLGLVLSVQFWSVAALIIAFWSALSWHCDQRPSGAVKGQRLRSGTGPLTSLSKVGQPRTAIIVAMAKANDMSMSNSFGFEGKATRTARTI